jgi:hypothetical protein
MTNSSDSFKTYLFEYFHDGATWMVEIPATSMDDAKARIRKLPLAKPLGEMVAKVPASAGMIARFVCWLRNLRVRSY